MAAPPPPGRHNQSGTGTVFLTPDTVSERSFFLGACFSAPRSCQRVPPDRVGHVPGHMCSLSLELYCCIFALVHCVSTLSSPLPSSVLEAPSKAGSLRLLGSPPSSRDCRAGVLVLIFGMRYTSMSSLFPIRASSASPITVSACHSPVHGFRSRIENTFVSSSTPALRASS